jgi:hypothetical protein
VNALDSIVFENNTIPRFEVTYLSKSDSNYFTTLYWYQGIGASYGPFYFHTYFEPTPFGVGFQLICMQQNGETLYRREDLEDCFVINDISSQDNAKNNLLVYPNPAQHSLSISHDLKAVTFQVFDLFGRQMKFGFVTNNVIDVSELATGVYVLHLTIQDKDQEVFRFVKE